MSQYIDFTRIGEQNEKYNYMYPSDIVAELRIVQDVREAEHDGYCSDPGEDTGEWAYNQVTVINLTEYQYSILSKYCVVNENFSDDSGKLEAKSFSIKLEVLQQLFRDKICCGYCGYESDYITKEGTLTYTKDARIKKEIQTKAYFLSEKDQHRKSPDHYWYLAEEYFKRRDILKEALKEKGLYIRSDSKLCEKWMNNELEPTDRYYLLEDVVRCMVECKWCMEYSNMPQKMRAYKTLYEIDDSSDKIFSAVKEMILKAHPVPDKLPWLHVYV